MNIFITAGVNGLIFFVDDRDTVKLYIHKDNARENLFLSITIDFNKKNVTFSQRRKKQCTGQENTSYFYR